MPQHTLPDPEALMVPLSTALSARHSATHYEKEPLSLTSLSAIFKYACGARAAHHRQYPSGGNLHPLEFYVITTLPHVPGKRLYHYHTETHALEQLWECPEELSEHLRSATQNQPEHLFLITARWARSEGKYHDFAPYLALLESGHAAQNILLCGSALQRPMRPLAGFSDEWFGEFLELDPTKEALLYCIGF